MQVTTTIEVWQRGNWFVAKSPELDFVSQGRTVEEARSNLVEVIQIQFDEMRNLGRLADYLADCGYVVDGDNLTQQAEMVVGLTQAEFVEAGFDKLSLRKSGDWENRRQTLCQSTMLRPEQTRRSA